MEEEDVLNVDAKLIDRLALTTVIHEGPFLGVLGFWANVASAKECRLKPTGLTLRIFFDISAQHLQNLNRALRAFMELSLIHI